MRDGDDLPSSHGDQLCTLAYRFRHDGQDHVVVGVPVRPAPALLLTRAELAIARGLVRGCSNHDIATTRGSSVRTVANQVASLLRKLGLQSRKQVAVRLATVHLANLEEA
jgi:DNA-binding NarL/FixJ family response regulator